MIVFYTRYKVVETFDIKALMGFAFDCVIGMKNAPEEFKSISWTGDESGEWKIDRNVLAYEIDNETGNVAFRVAIVDENDELWTTDIALNERTHEIQLRLAREKKVATAEHNLNFRIPYMFKKIVRDGIGAMDEGLPVIDEPIYIDEGDISLASDIILRKRHFYLPVIYVSHPFYNDNYDLDVDELAKDMAGSAHVLVEKSSNISFELKKMTDGKNAYNGAIDVIYNDDSFRYLKWNEITVNQYRYKISHAIYSRMAMRNIDDECSLSAIRLKIKKKKWDINNIETQQLILEIEGLKAKQKEDAEYMEQLYSEIEKLEKSVNELENENYELRNKVNALTGSLKRKNGIEGKGFTLQYNEEQFYDDEIKRITLECIKYQLSTYGSEEKTRRDYHVLKDIIDNNSVSEIGNNIKNDMMRIIRKNKLSRSDVVDLKGLGFEVHQNGHDKYVFHGDDRYIITVSNSPSDHRDGENLAHEAVNLVFGRF